MLTGKNVVSEDDLSIALLLGKDSACSEHDLRRTNFPAAFGGHMLPIYYKVDP
jgi:hypothetical protein